MHSLKEAQDTMAVSPAFQTVLGCTEISKAKNFFSTDKIIERILDIIRNNKSI